MVIAKPKRKKRVGRPPIKIVKKRTPPEIDMSQVIYWIEAQATLQEIAGSFTICPQALKSGIKKAFGVTYQELYDKHSAKGLVSLRRSQFKLAEKQTGMAIWLGKQYLGQHDPDNRIKSSPNDTKLNKLFGIIEKQNVE